MTSARLNLAAALGFLAMPGLAQAQVTIVGDDARASLTYQCGEQASQLAEREALRVIQDYSLRYARFTIAREDPLTARKITALYHAKDWAALERLVVDLSCTRQVLPVQSLPFPAAGSMVPALRVTRLTDGTPLDLSQFKGRRVLVEFWATWCGPCVRQLPRVDSLAAEFGDRVAVIAVPHDDTRERVLAWVSKNPARWFVHTIDADTSVSRAFEIHGVPDAFFIDEDGRIAVSALNPWNHMELDEFVSFYRRTIAPRPDPAQLAPGLARSWLGVLTDPVKLTGSRGHRVEH